MGKVAWEITWGSDDFGEVVFAEDADGALKQWAYGPCEGCRPGACECTGNMEINRAPWADKHADEVELPLHAYNARGYRWNCSRCEYPYNELVEDWVVIENEAVCHDCMTEQETLEHFGRPDDA